MTDEELAKKAKIPTLVLKAIKKVESAGNPTAVRFEPHVFLRITGDNGKSKSPYVGQIPFTKDPVRKISLKKEETNRAAFERAALLDREAAIRSTSWGLYQVMGVHLIKLFGDEAVQKFDADPGSVSDQLLVRWFQKNPRAAESARKFDIMDLAKRYNGSERWGHNVEKEISKLRG